MERFKIEHAQFVQNINHLRHQNINNKQVKISKELVSLQYDNNLANKDNLDNYKSKSY